MNSSCMAAHHVDRVRTLRLKSRRSPAKGSRVAPCQIHFLRGSLSVYELIHAATSPADPTRRPDCLAGVEGLELRNVDANYLFERLHRFAAIQPNSGFGDHSRLSCSAGIRSSGLGSAGIFSKQSAPTLAIMRRRREGTNWPRSLLSIRSNRPATASNTIAQFALDFARKERCVVITDAEPDRLAPLTPPAPDGPPRGLGGGGALLRRHS